MLGIVIFVIFFVTASQGMALGALMTVHGIDDAGMYPGEGAYLRFEDAYGNYYVVPDTEPEWTTSAQAYAYAVDHGIQGPWVLQSAGNIWAPDLVVGESLAGLHGGTYRITPVGGAYTAYMFDAWGWDENYRDRYWWELHVYAQKAFENGQYRPELFAMLGNIEAHDTEAEAFQSVSGTYLDITVAEGGSLSFWIWDWNSIDNGGGLAFDISRVPEPSAALLLAAGVPFLYGRRRR